MIGVVRAVRTVREARGGLGWVRVRGQVRIREQNTIFIDVLIVEWLMLKFVG